MMIGNENLEKEAKKMDNEIRKMKKDVNEFVTSKSYESSKVSKLGMAVSFGFLLAGFYMLTSFFTGYSILEFDAAHESLSGAIFFLVGLFFLYLSIRAK